MWEKKAGDMLLCLEKSCWERAGLGKPREPWLILNQKEGGEKPLTRPEQERQANEEVR